MDTASPIDLSLLAPHPRVSRAIRLTGGHGEVELAWAQILGKLDFAFQPIVNIHTGFCFGYEALLRNHHEAGFASIQDVFDTCHTKGVLTEVHDILLDKVFAKFCRLPFHQRVKLFFNLDNRLLAGGFDGSRVDELMRNHGLAAGSVLFEISERHPIGSPGEATAQLRQLKKQNFKLAMDDFGTGFAGLQMLYFSEPDLIKIDRFFISGIAADSKKKLFLAKIVNIAHLLGGVVVAEGVETEEEYFTCKDIGCDLVQGYLVQRPTLHLSDLAAYYPLVDNLARRERRDRSSDQKVICDRMEVLEPICIDTDMMQVFERFRSDKSATFFPVVDSNGEPLGIVRERDLKEYTYSLYGKELIFNKKFGKKLGDFLTRCPIADLNSRAENILQTLSVADDEAEGLIIVYDMRYMGFLSARSLLQIINEKNLQAARDQNPLTKLPGNNVIHEYLSQALADSSSPYLLVYFDFDNFKPFNDKYGFRLGDRAILMFAEMLVKLLKSEASFVGHIGGDDFFAGFRGTEYDLTVARVSELCTSFRDDVASFYDTAARQAGCISAPDRDGVTRCFPLLAVSAALLYLPAGRAQVTSDAVGWLCADLKKTAKASPDHLSAASLPRQ